MKFTCKTLLTALITAVVSVNPLRGSDDIPTSGITAGIAAGEYPNACAGYTFGAKILWPKTSLIKGYGGFSFGAEASYTGRFIIAPKISFSVNMLLSFGATVLYYTDFNIGALRFRPEIGVSTLGVRIVYGRNLTVANYEFPGLNSDNFILTVYFPVFDAK